MKKLPFKNSSIASIGVELEIQLINPTTFDMKSGAKELLQNIERSGFDHQIKPEITQSMLEINSSIHLSPQTMYEEFLRIREFLLQQAQPLKINFCGGGTHPFQKWSLRKIFPTKRFKNLSRIYRYLSKQSTVFGQHIHFGCSSGEEALLLTHMLARYVPQLIAISASSPYYQGVDTGYHSCRSTVFNAFPQSGVVPFVTTWADFSTFFYKLKNLGIVKSMKDFYWDVRPKPEFGTVEIRVCDTPLSIKTAIILAAYAQTLGLYLLQERPFLPSPDLYFLYNNNRFQACRYGFSGELIDPFTLQRRTIGQDIQETLEKISKYSSQLNNEIYLQALASRVANKENDATTIRQVMKQVGSLRKLVSTACDIWEKD